MPHDEKPNTPASPEPAADAGKGVEKIIMDLVLQNELRIKPGTAKLALGQVTPVRVELHMGTEVFTEFLDGGPCMTLHDACERLLQRLRDRVAARRRYRDRHVGPGVLANPRRG